MEKVKLITSQERAELEQANEATPGYLNPGTILNGHYQVIRRIATGSMGTVYLCRHSILSSRLMAVKVLAPEIAKDKVAVQRFYDEVATTYELNHPNVIRTFDFFREGNICGFSMEYIDGGDLLDLINSDEVLSFSQIIDFLLQICDGISVIHDLGIIHRDIKPENMLLTKDHQLKIADFGIAHLNTGSRKTEAGNLLGAIDYLSPEYIEREEFDQRSDIYAIGMLAYKMITGRTAFEGMSLVNALQARINTDPHSPKVYREDCPEALEQIVLQSIHRDPNARYQNVNELRDALAALELEDSKGFFKFLPERENFRKLAFLGGSLVCTALIAWAYHNKQLQDTSLALQLEPTAVETLVESEVPAEATMENIAISEARIEPVPVAVVEPEVIPEVNDETPAEIIVEEPKEAEVVETVTAPVVETNEIVNQPLAQPPLVHRVRYSGETLSLIAGWYTGNVDNWVKLADANPGMTPDKIGIRDRIVIPRDLVTRDAPFPKGYIPR